MAFGYPPYAGFQPNQTYLQNNNYQPAYPTPYPARPEQQQFAQPAAQGTGGVSARVVTGREEAVAAQIMPDGNIWIFADFAHGTIYTKQVNPQTLVADFREYHIASPTLAEPAAHAPEFVTLDAFQALQAEVEALKTAQTAPTTTKKTSGGESK